MDNNKNEVIKAIEETLKEIESLDDEETEEDKEGGE